MIFVDTSGWYALFVSSDPNHDKALIWLSTNEDTLITTNYIVDETLTLLRARRNSPKAIELGDKFFKGQLAQVHMLSELEIYEVGRFFERLPIRIGASLTAQVKRVSICYHYEQRSHSTNTFLNLGTFRW